MTKYIQDTLKAIDLKVQLLQGLRSKLESTFKDWTIEVDAEPAQSRSIQPAATQRRNPPAGKSAASKTSKTIHPPGAGSKIQDLLELAKSWPEPFGSAQIQAALHCNWITASNLITRAVAKGCLRRVGYGKYERGKNPHTKSSVQTPRAGTKPNAAPEPPSSPVGHVHVPGLDRKELSLQEQLDEVIRLRDKAVADGHTTLQRIYQDRITQIEAKLRL